MKTKEITCAIELFCSKLRYFRYSKDEEDDARLLVIAMRSFEMGKEVQIDEFVEILQRYFPNYGTDVIYKYVQRKLDQIDIFKYVLQLSKRLESQP